MSLLSRAVNKLKRERRELAQLRAARESFQTSPWAQIPDVVRGRVVVIADAPVPYLRRDLQERGVDRPSMLCADGQRKGWRQVSGLKAVHRRLLARGPFDTILAETGVLNRPELLRELLYYLDDGGHFVLVGNASALAEGQAERPLDSLLKNSKRENLPREARDGFAHAVGSLRATDKLLIVQKSGLHFVPILEDELSADFARRLGWDWVEVREVEPARPYEFTSVATMNMPQYEKRFRKRGTLPARRIRIYDDVIVAPRQVVTKGMALLPETFRHYRSARIHTRRAATWVNDRFMQLKEPRTEVVDLPGTYLNLDSEFVHIYGHLVTEVVSRLWAWDELKSEFPDLKVLVGLYEGREELPPWFVRTLVSYGIPAEDIVAFSGSVRVERLIGVTPLFSMPFVAHPKLLDVWARMRDTLVTEVPDGVTTPDRIFVARRTSVKRNCHQEEELLAFFREHGFEIFYPEDHDISVQALTFKNASVIAGYGGSGMLNGIYARPGQRWIVVAPDTYGAMNEYLICSLFGNPIHYFYGPADTRHPRGRWSVFAFKSDYSFDLETDGAGLKELVASLDASS